MTALQGKPSPDPAWPGSKSRPSTPQMALYFCSGVLQDRAQFRHYALNVPLYTHFTSPIRRFADVLVHRLLAATLGKTQHWGSCGLVPPSRSPAARGHAAWLYVQAPRGRQLEQPGSLGPETPPP